MPGRRPSSRVLKAHGLASGRGVGVRLLLIAGARIVLRPAQRPVYSFAAISGSSGGPAGSSRTNGAGIVLAVDGRCPTPSSPTRSGRARTRPDGAASRTCRSQFGRPSRGPRRGRPRAVPGRRRGLGRRQRERVQPGPGVVAGRLRSGPRRCLGGRGRPAPKESNRGAWVDVAAPGTDLLAPSAGGSATGPSRDELRHRGRLRRRGPGPAALPGPHERRGGPADPGHRGLRDRRAGGTSGPAVASSTRTWR